MRTCLVRGSGDVGSAVAHALLLAGFAVAIHDVPAPAHPRRGRAFLDAMFDGHATLEGVTAERADDLDALESVAFDRDRIAITSQSFGAVLAAIAPAVLVDARMRKREVPETQRGLAPLTIGLGPNFVAGRTTDLVVETAWGDDLGKVIVCGPSAAFTGVPRVIDGHGGARYGYAPARGHFHAAAHLGILVGRGDEVGRVGDFSVDAPIDGVIVGLTRWGIDVASGMKILEVDPRARPELAFGIGERARRIALGVLTAIRMHESSPRRANSASASHSHIHSGARP